MKNKVSRGRGWRILAILLLAVITLGSAAVPALPALNAKVTMEDVEKTDAAIKKLEDKLAKIQSDKKDLNKKISQAKDTLEDQLEYKSYLDRQLKLTQDDIDTTTALIVEYGNLIHEYEDEIARLEQEVTDNYEIVKQILRQTQMEGNVSYLAMLLTADSFTEFLVSAERVSCMLDYEMKSMQNLNSQAEQLKALSAKTQEVKQYNDSLAAQLSEKQIELTNSATQNAKYILQLESTKAAAEKNLKRKIAEEDALDKEIEELLVERQRQLNSIYAGGVMIWPCDTKYSRISRGVGWSNFDNAYHRGIDIPLSYGADVLAATDGTVVSATYHSSYGYYVLIDHGGGIATLYAHNSKLTVSAGDKVKCGDVIGKAGSTGNSYGNHIHFEVRVDGKCVDPLDKFVKQPVE
ncbi:MAG: peptidoglycan DD-metalloendopeptidase family protein [Clostridiales bacterium]|nr:peptidoglycan DD-metalloendopeptidase family protein [Clostridiales bacterium]